jgi:hypothetical protein
MYPLVQYHYIETIKTIIIYANMVWKVTLRIQNDFLKNL